MTIEQVQAYWDKRPCNVRHSQANINKEPLAYSSDVTLRKLRVEPHLAPFSEFNKWAGKRVLDAGCGIGTQAILFAKAGASVFAIDLSPKSLEIANIRAAAEGVSQDIQFYRANLEELRKFTGKAVDLIYSWGTLHHTPNPITALRQLRKFANEQTVFKIMLYNRFSWKSLWILATYGKFQFWKTAELIRQYSEAQSGSPISRTYSRADARKLLANAGLEITAMSIDHIFPYRIADYIEHRYVKEWYWRHMPAWLFRALERQFGWHLMINARLKTVPISVASGWRKRAGYHNRRHT